jgi:hypothetical protein
MSRALPILLLFFAFAFAAGASSASASPPGYLPFVTSTPIGPDKWVATGSTATLGADGTSMQYAIKGRSGTWTMQATAGYTHKPTVPWRYKGFHAYYRVTVGIERFVIRDGREIMHENLVSASAQQCCSAPSGGFDYSSKTQFDVRQGDIYGFRMTGSNSDRDARLDGSLTLTLDRRRPDIYPVVSGTKGNDDWYTSDVAVYWTGSKEEDPDSFDKRCFRSVLGDTDGLKLTCEAHSDGGSITKTLWIKRDATPPAITLSGPDVTNGVLAFNGGRGSQYAATAQDAMSGVVAGYMGDDVNCLLSLPNGVFHLIPSTSSALPSTGPLSCSAKDLAGNIARLNVRVA